MRATRIPVAAVLLGSALILAGCGQSPPADEPAPSSPPVTDQRAPETESATGVAAATPPAVPIEDLSVQVERKRPEIPGIDVVRRYTELFYSGQLDELYQQFSVEMQTEILPREALAELHGRVRQELGEEVAVLGEDYQTKDGYRGFVRWARFSNHEDPIEMQWVLREEDDTIAGFFIRPVQRKQP